MAEEKGKKEVNPLAEAKNWEDRLRTEQEAPKKWAADWGSLFQGEVPHDYSKRVQYLEERLKTLPPVDPIPKYGQGKPFKEFGDFDFKRKKMAREDVYEENY